MPADSSPGPSVPGGEGDPTAREAPARAREVLDALGALADSLEVSKDPLEVCQTLFRFARRVTPADTILVALYDAATQERTCVYSADAEGEDDVAGMPRMPLGDSPQSTAVKTGRPVVSGDLEAALVGKPVIYVGLERDARLSMSSVAVPMKLRGETMGVFELQSYMTNAFDQRHVDALRLAAVVGAMALEDLRAPATTRRQGHIRARRQRLSEVIASQAFQTVFQPLVDLTDGRTVGHEALSRFDDRVPPDRQFADATTCGLGTEMEVATLRRAFDAARALPDDTWLSVNASPRLVLAHQPLHDLIAASRRRCVVEVTEHASIGDYGLFRRAFERLPSETELAIDDAGAGYSSFRHILELQPRLVKLDRHLISGIDLDKARQALVRALATFAGSSGALLVAEGIETQAELAVLQALRVPLGQGYLLGRPTPTGQRPGGVMPVPPTLPMNGHPLGIGIAPPR